MINFLESYSSIAFTAYLALMAYTCYSTIKFQNIFYKRYPSEAKNLLGSEKFWGLNTKQGLLFLADYSIKNLIKNDVLLAKARNKAIFFWCLFIFMMFGLVFIPIAILIIGKIVQ